MKKLLLIVVALAATTACHKKQMMLHTCQTTSGRVILSKVPMQTTKTSDGRRLCR